jgi:hypothetical protein
MERVEKMRLVAELIGLRPKEGLVRNAYAIPEKLSFGPNVYQLEDMKFDTSLDWLMPVIEEVKRREHCPDNHVAIEHLLGGGYKFGEGAPLPRLDFSAENLFARAVTYEMYRRELAERSVE